MADLLMNMAIASLVLVAIAVVMMVLTVVRFTRGFWKTYITWLMVSGLLMSFYLAASVFSKLGALKPYAPLIIIAGFVSEAIASLTYIKSSRVLDKMGTKFGFAKDKSLVKTLKLEK